MSYVPTRHCEEAGPVSGFVYLAVRDEDYSVKIGSTGYTPANRISSTETVSQNGFLIACATGAMRELEYFLHRTYANAGRKLPGRDNFDLKVEDVLHLAHWFNGGVFGKDEGGDDGELTLVDRNGRPVRSSSDFGVLLGKASRVAIDAQLERDTQAEWRQREASNRLWNYWSAQVSEAWGIPRWRFSILNVCGDINPQINAARKSIEAGRCPRIPSKPRFLTHPDPPAPESDTDMEWLGAMVEKTHAHGTESGDRGR